MSEKSNKLMCDDLDERWEEVLEGQAGDEVLDHLAECDRCRDLRHELEALPETVDAAGADFQDQEDWAERVLAVLDEPSAATAGEGEAMVASGVRKAQVPADDAASTGVDSHQEAEAEDKPAPVTNVGTALAGKDKPAAPTPRKQPGEKSNRKNPARWLGWVGLAAAAAVALVVLARKGVGPSGDESEAIWQAKLADISRASSQPGSGVEICDDAGKQCKAAKPGQTLATGVIRTDGKTRVKLALKDGSELRLDRASVMRLRGQKRAAELQEGAMIADVFHSDKLPNAEIELTGYGKVEVLGTRFALFRDKQRARVQVARGVVAVRDTKGHREKVQIGEEAELRKGSAMRIFPASDLASSLAWADRASEGEAPLGGSGLGELRAKSPGSKKEKDHALHLASHKVNVRIVDNIARTEVFESFKNDTNKQLEGVYRFPLPPGAKIERLALEVDGKWMEGAFVPKRKAKAIWRGVIKHAAPKAQRRREEIIWVPGPWADPALLEWKRGGRFELRIFPIKPHQTRRIKLAYTEQVKPNGGGRRYVYPLAHDASGSTKVDDFQVDVQVRGHEKQAGVQARGYGLTARGDGDMARFHYEEEGFSPRGNLAVDYRLASDRAEVFSYAHKGKDGTYVVLAVRPKLPRAMFGKRRNHLVIVDSSRSMVGERLRRAKQLATSLVAQLDPRDKVIVAACDLTCRRLTSEPLDGGKRGGARASKALQGLSADGSFSLLDVAKFARSQAALGSSKESWNHVVISDGGVSMGPTTRGHLAKAVGHVWSKEAGALSAIAVGSDANLGLLRALARAGNGVAIPFRPGQRAYDVALSALTAFYGVKLNAPKLELPEGLRAVAPAKLDNLMAGQETLVVARMDGDSLRGNAVLSGSVGGESFMRSYPLDIRATSDGSNGFVPRVYASERISDLEDRGGVGATEEMERLSKAYRVASSVTSLLVLESQAMFDAYGIKHTKRDAVWRGDRAAARSAAPDLLNHLDSAKEAKDAKSADVEGEPMTTGKKPAMMGDVPMGAESKAAGRYAVGAAGPAKKRKVGARPPAARPAPKPAPPRRVKGGGFSPFDIMGDDDGLRKRGRRRRRFRRRMRPMRVTYVRKGQIHGPTGLWNRSLRKRLPTLEGKVAEQPNHRQHLADLFGVYSQLGELAKAEKLATRWASRDALDPAALQARADILLRKGHVKKGLRVLSGVVDLRPDSTVYQTQLASFFERRGDGTKACQFRIALAESRPDKLEQLVAAIRCVRAQKTGLSLEDLVASRPKNEQSQVEAALAKAPPKPLAFLAGDVRMSAEWTGGDDLDLCLVDKHGRRLSWLGAGKTRVFAKDGRSKQKERVSLLGLPAGKYLLEITRRSGGASGKQAGHVDVSVAGTRRRLKFELSASRQVLGAVEVNYHRQLVPLP